MRRLLFTLACCLLPSLASAATYWVHPSGNNVCTNTTTPQGGGGGAKTTIAGGIACMTGGDTLNIRAGTYNENIIDSQLVGKSGSSYASPTTIQAYQTEVVTIKNIDLQGGPGLSTSYIVFKADRTAHNFIIQQSHIGQSGNTGNVDHIKLDGLEVIGIPDWTAPGTDLVLLTTGDAAATDIWYAYLKVHANVPLGGCSSGGPGPHGFYLQSPNNIVENTEMYNMPGFGIHNYDQTGGRAINGVYRNNYIHDTGNNQPGGCPQTVFALGMETGSGGVVYNNVLANNGSGIDVAGAGGSGVLIYNNTLFGNGTLNKNGWCCYEALRNNGGATVTNNLVMGNNVNSITNASGLGSNNLVTNTNPFISSGSGNFQLTAGSAPINAGTPTPYAFDIAGVTRPQGANGLWDIGAYEFTSGAPLPTVVISTPTQGQVVFNSPYTFVGTSSLP